MRLINSPQRATSKQNRKLSVALKKLHPSHDEKLVAVQIWRRARESERPRDPERSAGTKCLFVHEIGFAKTNSPGIAVIHRGASTQSLLCVVSAGAKILKS